MRRKFCNGVVLIMSALLLLCTSSCGKSTSVSAKEAEINQYNSVVKQTLQAYFAVKDFAEENKSAVINLVFDGTATDLYQNELSPMDLEEFRGEPTRDLFFTAYGATGVREVLEFSGYSAKLYVTVMWGSDSIISVERQVIKV